MNRTKRLAWAAGPTLLALVGCSEAYQNNEAETSYPEAEDVHEEHSGHSEEGLTNQPEEQPLQDGEERYGEGSTPIADVQVQESRFIFLSLAAESGESLGVGMIERIHPATPDPQADPRLASGTPLDLFLALTPEETAIPEELLAFEDQAIGKRGWFLDVAANSERIVPRAICNNADFRASLRNHYPSINDDERWRTNAHPGDGRSGWTGPSCGDTGLGCAPGTVPSYFSLFNNGNSWSVFNVDEVKQQIAICTIHPFRTVCPTLGGGCNAHLGPTVRFHFRTENNASTGSVFSRDMAQSDLNSLWRWRWTGTPAAGNNDFDWRIRLNNIKQQDRFDMGWIFEHRGW